MPRLVVLAVVVVVPAAAAVVEWYYWARLAINWYPMLLRSPVLLFDLPLILKKRVAPGNSGTQKSVRAG